MKFPILKILVIILFPLLSCHNEKTYPNGLNREIQEKANKEFYIYENQLDGIYFSTIHDSLVVLGTYAKNRRNGLWDTNIFEGIKSQVFYHNGEAKAVLKNKYYFNFFKMNTSDFCFLNPANWQIIDSLDVQSYYYSISNTFKGKYKPRLSIYRLLEEDKNSPVNASIDSLLHQLTTDSTCIEIERNAPNKCLITQIEAPDTFVNYIKAINTKKGKFCLHLKCHQEDYFYSYQYIFETIGSSFSSISGMESSDGSKQYK